VQAIAGVVFDPNAPVARWDFEDAAARGDATLGTDITLGLTGATTEPRETGDNALVLAAAEILVAPVPGAFDWTGAWTVAAWLRVEYGVEDQWVLSKAKNINCDTTCGGSANVDTVTMASINTADKMLALAASMGIPCTATFGRSSYAGLPTYICEGTDCATKNECGYCSGGTCGTSSVYSANYQTICRCKNFNFEHIFLHDGAATTNVAAAVSGADLTAGAWTHVALTYPGSGTAAALHVNGAAAGTTVDVSALQTDGGSVRITGAAVDDLRVYTTDWGADVEQAGAPAAAVVAPPPVTYDFTSADSASAWTSKAQEIDAGATTNTLTWDVFSPGTGGVYGNDSGGTNDGYLKFALPSAYNTITITSGNDFSGGNVNLYIDTQTKIDDGSAVADFTWGASSTSTRWFSYTDGDWLMLKETDGVILGDTIMTFSYLASSYGFCDATDADAASCAALLPAMHGDTGGWRLVRHIPASTCTTSGGTETCTGYWYTGNDNLVGSDVRAPDSDYAVATASEDVQWTKEFGNFDEYLISSGDQARWIQFAKTELVKVTTTGSTSAQSPPGDIINSYLGTITSTFITWWRGTDTTPEDPNIYYPTQSDVFYQEHNPDPTNQAFWTTLRMKGLEHGMNFFVREAPVAGLT
jgi:hypothetical protein